MGDNGRGGRVTGRSQGSVGGGGIYTLYASIIWAKTSPTTDPSSSVNGDSGRAVSPAYISGESGRKRVLAILCATITLNSSSFKGSVAGTFKNRI